MNVICKHRLYKGLFLSHPATVLPQTISVATSHIHTQTRAGGVPAGRCQLLRVVFPVLCHYFQCAYSVVPTRATAFFVLLLMHMVLYAWSYLVLLNSM